MADEVRQLISGQVQFDNRRQDGALPCDSPCGLAHGNDASVT